MKTPITKLNDIKRHWHLIDLKDQNLGRSAVAIAKLLMGKHKATYTPNMDDGDYVVAINAKDIAVTGKKLLKKTYTRFSGFPSGLTITSLSEQLTKDPTKVITHAVKGMLPKNRLQSPRLARLKVFSNTTHPYENQLKTVNKV